MRKPTFLLAGLVPMILVCVCATAAAIEPAGPFRGKFSEGFETQQDSFVTELPVFGGESTVRNLFDGPYLHVSGCWTGIGTVCAHSGICFMGSVGGGVEWIFDVPAGRFGGYFTVLDLLPNTEGAVAYFYDVNDNLLTQMDVNAPYSTWIWNGWVSDVPIKRIEIIGLGSSGWLDLGGFVMHDDMEYTPFGEPGTIYYVNDDATGANDGSSWKDAFVYLQDALAAAHYGDEILVAQGIYKPDQGASITAGDREATFQLINGVTLKGGYGGADAPDPDARDVELYEAILSGDLNGDDDPCFANNGDNSYHVVTGSGTDEIAVLDGFTITGGNANGSYRYNDNNCGGGMYNKSGSPTLTNCTFIANTAIGRGCGGSGSDGGGLGGGLYNKSGSPRLRNCIFYRNSASGYGYGAGIHTDRGNPTLTNCTFIENSIIGYGRGGGVYNLEGTISLETCLFSNNLASSGAGIDNYDRHNLTTSTNCTFIGNVAEYSGGGFSGRGASMINCKFIENSASRYGGAISCSNFGITISNCTFRGNSAEYGGGIDSCITTGWTTLTNSIFTGNSASSRGGGLCACRATISGCSFSRNSAQYGGGIDGGERMTVTNCILSANSAEYGGGFFDRMDSESTVTQSTFIENCADYGGAMFNHASESTITNCIFSGNMSYENGGGMYIDYGEPTLANCTFADNSASNGDALACDSFQQMGPSNLHLTNCIIWDGENPIWNNDGSTITITYSDVQGGWPGEGNIDADPFFIDPGYWDANGTPADANDDFWVDGDYHLRTGSPCIDAGTDAGVYEDIEGNVRPFDFPAIDNNGELADFDMGAYEAVEIEGELKIVPRTVNRRSDDGQVIAVMQLPLSDAEDDIAADEPLVLLPGDIKAVEQKIMPKDGGELSKLRIRAVFYKAELLEAIPDNGEADVTIIGRFISGRHFYGTDTIRIISSQK